MSNSKWLNVAKKCATLMVVLGCLCTVVGVFSARAEAAGIPEQSEEYKKGIELYRAHDYNGARPFFETGAKKGDPWCMLRLSYYYMQGLGGLPQDKSRVIEMTKKAADLDLPDALTNLGRYYLDGTWGLPKDTKKGNELIRRAAEMGNTGAKNEITTRHQSGEYQKGKALHDQKKYKEACKLFEKGAQNGDEWCMNMLGTYYVQGMVQKDEARGVQWKKKAADLNLPEALYDLGGYYLDGKYGLSKDAKKGIELITKAAELDLPFANSTLGKYYEEGKYVNKNLQTALTYYKKAKALKVSGIDDKIKSVERQLENDKRQVEIDKFAAKGILLVEYPADIVMAFQNNEIAADNKYKGKTVRIEKGRVVEIGKNNEGNPYVGINADYGMDMGIFGRMEGLIGDMAAAQEELYVLCIFDKKNANDVAALKKGAQYSFEGKCQGLGKSPLGLSINQIVIFTNCRVIK